MIKPAESSDDADSAMTWQLHADDVEVTTRPVPNDGTGPPLLEVTLTHTALDVPAFTFVMCPDDIRAGCARGLQLGWFLEHAPDVGPTGTLRLA